MSVVVEGRKILAWRLSLVSCTVGSSCGGCDDVRNALRIVDALKSYVELELADDPTQEQILELKKVLEE